MGLPRRVWDSNVVIGFLCGSPQTKPDCELIIAQAERGELEIVVSAIVEAEVAYLKGVEEDDAELKIREFFSRDYIIVAAVDRPVTRLARKLIRQYHLTESPDAVIMATTVHLQVPILETYEKGLLGLDGSKCDPPIVIRQPQYSGTISMFSQK
jgi:predicted nucleic acid-binding protein